MIEIPCLPDEVRASLPPMAQAYISALETSVGELRAQVQTLQARVTELQARVDQTSQNSSRPPSSDPPGAPPRPERPPSGRKRGGQLGHKFHERPLLPESELKDVFEHHAEI